jgi:hypothetical protein
LIRHKSVSCIHLLPKIRFFAGIFKIGYFPVVWKLVNFELEFNYSLDSPFSLPADSLIPQQQAVSRSAALIVLMAVSFCIAATRTLGKEQMIDHVWHSPHSCFTEQKYTIAHSIMVILIMFHNKHNHYIFRAEYICERFCFHSTTRRIVLAHLEWTSHHTLLDPEIH